VCVVALADALSRYVERPSLEWIRARHARRTVVPVPDPG